MDFTLPNLPYAYNALEPHFDKETMQIHHTKHHQSYINNLQKAVEGTKIAEMKLEDVLRNLNAVPENIRTAVKNHGGGVYHHSFFWTILSPNGGGKPKGNLITTIESTFGTFKEFQEKFDSTAATQFGSGWAWLCKDKNNNLKIIATHNQDSPLQQGLTPILGIDVWEHAYYLKFQNRRAEYIATWWNVINWEQVEKYFKE